MRFALSDACRTTGAVTAGRRNLGIVEAAGLRVRFPRLSLASEARHWFVDAIVWFGVALVEAITEGKLGVQSLSWKKKKLGPCRVSIAASGFRPKSTYPCEDDALGCHRPADSAPLPNLPRHTLTCPSAPPKTC